MLSLLDPDDPAAPFPPVEQAEREPDGLLAVGGDLHPTRLLNAYRAGIFPWYTDQQPLLWWSPDPRTVLFPERLKVSRSLRKSLRNKGFGVTFDQAFGQVIAGCAAPRQGEAGTWITPDMAEAYTRLHRMGHAHSVEVWREGELAGGLYGVAMGRVFFGESMFSRVTDASKVGFVHLVRQLQAHGFHLIDCQVHTRHLISLGAEEIPRREFVRQLDRWCPEAGVPGSWAHWPAPASA
ncbi:MAG TPA: leucyl/phenylalanyl-tRNA--protein transferase [Sedimenticola thiotaurini]|uniref:Leucyl/phenylalanyl-tRNA--protein transferase n=1 Tax=Sedimenticola thiotaurini TaxID=1543721 RepID=A0A831W9I2_9GAMM|nr:leucyl/phenylalanyl-tRNA--protein transferase [Sedimenticola thiotaurini]